MRKYQTVFILTLWLFFVFNFYLNTTSSNLNSKVYLKDLNRSVPNFKELLSVPVEKIYKNDYKLWDMKISKLLEDRDKKALEKTKNRLKNTQLVKIKEKNINIKNRIICLEKICWEFLGVVTLNNITTVTLLSTEKKAKLKSFQVGDMLLEDIKITDIQGDIMTLKALKKKKVLRLELFSVDVEKYAPKKKIKDNNAS